MSGIFRFLRGKFKCFAKNPSQRTRCRIKKQSYKIIDRKYIVAEAPSTSNSGVLDLNQVSFPVIAEKVKHLDNPGTILILQLVVKFSYKYLGSLNFLINYISILDTETTCGLCLTMTLKPVSGVVNNKIIL